jgi:hypothetical protein
MKTRLIKAHAAILLTILIFLSATNNISAKEKIDKTLVDKKFEINKGALLKIDHKYGEVNCKNWNEDAISVKVTASVETSDPVKAENIFSKIVVNVEGNSKEVSVESNLNDKLFGNGKQNISIKIEVFMPKSIRLQLNHKFGNAYFEDVEGVSDIKSEYGNLDAGSLTGENSSVEISFGEGNIKYFTSGDIRINYSSFNVSEAKSLKVEANYSDFSLDKAVTLEIDNEGGKTEIGQVDVLKLTSKFSDCEVKQLAKVLNVESQYGGFKVQHILKSFASITVDNSFGSIVLNFEQGASFDIKAGMAFCTLEYPKDLADFSSRNVSPTESSYQGIVGKNNSLGANVDIHSEYGGVSINFN